MGAATACFALVRPACGILQRRPGRFAAHPEGDTIHAGTQADKTRSISFAGRARQCRLSGGGALRVVFNAVDSQLQLAVMRLPIFHPRNSWLARICPHAG